MEASDTPLDEHALHAYVDGRLPAEQLPRVLAWLQLHPEDAERVLQWQAQRHGLQRLARELPLGDAPAALSAPLRRPRWRDWPLRQAAALLLAVGLGVLGAMLGGRAMTPQAAGWSQAPGPRFVGEAVAAHAAFVPERRHPVEVTAADEAHLVQWLSRRLGEPLRVPDLLPLGYRLLGGRLLPGEAPAGTAVPDAPDSAVPRAQFMFEDASGARLTLYVAVFAPQAAVPTAFRSERQGTQSTFYWTDDRLGYALSGPSGLPLERVAAEVHRQLSP